MDESWRPIIRLFKIFPASNETVTVFIVIVIFLIFVAVGIPVIIYLQQRRKIILEEWEWFYRMCEEKDLSEAEMKLLREMIKKCKVRNPVSIFKSVKLFDKCVIREFKRLNLSEIEREEYADDISELRKKLHYDRFLPGDILHSTREIPPKQRIRVGLEINGKKHYFRSIVQDIKEDSIVILSPKLERFAGQLEVGKPVEIYFWNYGDAGYTFSTVINNIIDDAPGFLYIDHSDKLERSQRRHYFRIYIHLPLYFRSLTPEQRTELAENGLVQFPKDLKPHPGKITSLSGGGASFVTDTTFPNGKLLWLEIEISGSHTITNIYGKVIRSKKIGKSKFKLYIEFVFISDNEREMIVGFVTAHQREKVRL